MCQDNYLPIAWWPDWGLTNDWRQQQNQTSSPPFGFLGIIAVI